MEDEDKLDQNLKDQNGDQNHDDDNQDDQDRDDQDQNDNDDQNNDDGDGEDTIESLKDGVSPEKLSLLECAIRELQTSQMWAVKAITYQY